jgi:cytochrome c553
MRRILGLLASAAVLGLAPPETPAAGPLDHPGATRALVCSACHGFGGQSPSDTVPILAGMPPWYFRKAIADYAEGRRPSTEMEPYAKMTRQFGVDDIAAFFAAQPRRPTAVRADPAAAARGRAAAQQCVVCHGTDGRGDAAKGVPDLTGQPPGYLRAQMGLFREDRRSPGDPALRALKALMRELPEETLADLAAYYSSLR